MIVLTSVTHKPFSLLSLLRAKRLNEWRTKLAKRELDDRATFPIEVIRFAEPAFTARLLSMIGARR